MRGAKPSPPRPNSKLLGRGIAEVPLEIETTFASAVEVLQSRDRDERPTKGAVLVQQKKRYIIVDQVLESRVILKASRLDHEEKRSTPRPRKILFGQVGRV